MLRGHKLILLILLLPMLLRTEAAFGQEGSQETNAEKPVRTLQITIKEKASGKPLNGVEVHLSSSSGWEATGQTSASGIAKFSKVPEGEVRVSVPTQQGWKKRGAVVGGDQTATEISLEKESGPQTDDDHDRGHDGSSGSSH